MDAAYQRDKFIRSTYQTESQKQLTLTTGLVDEEHYRWFQELLISPELWKLSKVKQDIGAYNVEEQYLFESLQIVDFQWELLQDSNQYNLTLTVTASTPENKTVQNALF